MPLTASVTTTAPQRRDLVLLRGNTRTLVFSDLDLSPDAQLQFALELGGSPVILAGSQYVAVTDPAAGPFR